MVTDLLIAVPLFALAAGHSALGEMNILRPLFAADWQTTRTPRQAMERILRFVWHLTSVGWIALGLIALGVSASLAISAMGLTSAAVIFFALRGHLAWPLFLLAGLAALWREDIISDAALTGVGIATATLLAALAVVHVYWAFGGSWLAADAVPSTDDSTPTFTPGRALTLVVAGALVGFATLVGAAVAGVGPAATIWLIWAGVAVFAIRAIGDTKFAGFTKSVRGTRFAEFDDRFFTPLVVFLAFGSAAAALL